MTTRTDPFRELDRLAPTGSRSHPAPLPRHAYRDTSAGAGPEETGASSRRPRTSA